MSTPLRLGTRGSPLALWQAHHVADRLRPLIAPRAVELVIVQTTGDRVRDLPLAQIGGDGLFTKEIQNTVLEDKADVAVHSLKDLPTFPVEGLILGAVPERGPRGDAFLSDKYAHFDDLPPGAVVATGSLRRRAQVLHRRPDLHLVDIRGNVETRLRKLHEGGLDATLLAEAGLHRLGRDNAITELLDLSWMLPAVGQGALGLECRTDDAITQDILAALNHLPTRQEVLAERALLASLGGGCQVPLGVSSHHREESLILRAAVLSPDGTQRIEGTLEGPAVDPQLLGSTLADELRRLGAGALLSAG